MEKLHSMGDQFLDSVNRIVEENLDNENFSVEDLAQYAGLSRSMLHRKLIKLTGKSATDFITMRRLIRAKELLETDVSTASEIAYKVGFSSPSYFHRVFKKYFKLSPGDVRKGTDIYSDQHYYHNKHKKKVLTGLKAQPLRVYGVVFLFVLVIITGAIFYLSRETGLVEKSIAVLPFTSINKDQENQYFADGIVDDLLSKLSRIEGLKVISRTSSELYREKGKKTIPQIAAELGVSYIIEGSVQRDKDKARVSVQLIDARKDDHIWSDVFDRNLNDLFKIQSEIAIMIASKMNAILTDTQKSEIQKNYTTDTKAFELYQAGRFHSSKRWIDGYQKGIEYYEKALKEDPDYALAYEGLADNYHLMAIQNWINRIEGKEKATELAIKALELDPGLAGPHTVLGSLFIYTDWNWEKAEEELLLALKLNPNYSTAHQYYSELLAMTDRLDKAREHINKALELNPFSFIMHYISSYIYYNQGLFKESLAENEVCLNLVKDHKWAVQFAFEIYVQLGLKEKAVESFKRCGRLFGDYDPAIADSVYANEGLTGLLRIRAKTEPSKSKSIPFYVMLGDYEKALDLMESYLYKKGFDPIYLTRYEFRNMRDNPRFIEICKNVGMQPYYSWIK